MNSASDKSQKLPVAIIGAGPVGLAAAAHLASRDLQAVLFEKGHSAAHAIRSWSHVRVFSPWKFNIDAAARELLENSGWKAPDPDGLPTGAEMLKEYLEPLAAHPRIAKGLHYNATVVSVIRKGFDKVTTAGREDAPFVITWSDANGKSHSTEASAVIDASGTWFSPNPMGATGSVIEGEREFANRIFYGIPNVLHHHRERYSNQRVLVVGAGHSAINAVLDLLKLQEIAPETRVVWSLRRNRLEKLFGGGLNDKLPARGELGMAARRAINENRLELLVPFAPQRVEKTNSGLRVIGTRNGEPYEVEVDEVIVATGFRPDVEIFRELRVSLDPILESAQALAPMIDPNLHSCGTVPPHGVVELSHPEKKFYIVGSKSYGRAPTFLMATGYEQVRSVVAEIAGDHQAARDVRLVLPETGVCNASPKAESPSKPEVAIHTRIPILTPASASGCCGGPADNPEVACCVKDQKAKEAGQEGCGCNSTTTSLDLVEAQSSCCATQ